MASILINQGTQTPIANDTVGTINYQVVKLDMGTAGVTNPFSGTVPAISNLEKGTITRLENGTVQANLLTGTVTSLLGGSVAVTAGTINTGTINAGTINRVGQVGTLEVGTISSLPNLPGGSIQVTAGTVNTGTINTGTINLLQAGTVTRLEEGSVHITAGTLTRIGQVDAIISLPNLQQGSIQVTAGTVGGKAASGAAASGNPVFVGGTAASGSVYGLLTDTSGVLQINGTVATGGAGTQPVRLIDGTLTELSNLAKGTITRVEGGTITRIATIGTLEVGTVTLAAQIGTINVGTINTGTINTGTIDLVKAGTLTQVTAVNVLSTIYTLGTVSKVETGSISVTAGTITNLLKAEDAAHSGGDSGVMALAVRNDNGTALATTDLDYIPLQTDANGALRISGTVATGAGTQPVRLIDGTLTSITNLAAGTVTRLEQGSIQVTAGTIASVGTVPGVGVVTSVGTLIGLGTISNGNLVVRQGASTSTAGSFTASGQSISLTAVQSNYVDTNAFVSISGTHSGLNVAFEVSEDNSLWTPSNAVRTDTLSVGTSTGVITDNANYSWNVPMRGASYFRARSFAYVSGTANIRIKPFSGNSDPFISMGGTVTAALTASSVVVTTGTINTGTVASVGTVPGVGVVTTVSNITNGSIVVTAGTVAPHAVTAATITAGTLTNLISGTINSATAVINSATISVLPNLPQGSINVTAGTITEGTLRNLISGTINAATAVLNSGTINVATAVITTLPNLPQGSIQVTAGTVTTGSIVVTAGTVRQDSRTTQNILTYGTQIVGTAAIAATVIGSASVGAGTSLWLQDVSIVNPYGSVLCVLGFGTAKQGTNIFYRGVLGTQTGVGIEKSFAKPVNAGMTNQDLVMSLGAAGTVDLSLSYLISA